MTVITVREMVPADIPQWNGYVQKHAAGTFCHLAEWKAVIEEGAGQACPYLLAEKAGEIIGVLPLTLRNSLLFGKAAVSSMFCVYGGPLADSDETYEVLDAAAWKYAQKHGANVLEYRSVTARHIGMEGWHKAGGAATFTKPLQQDPGAILLDIPRKQRAVVRKAMQNTLENCFGHDLDGFYSLYASSVHGLGTPVFPKALFRALIQHFGEAIEIQVIRTAEGRAVASLMSFYYGDTVMPYYAGGNDGARACSAHDFMYYQLMIRAAEKGMKIFDFGRSKIDSGPYKFKKNWGFEPRVLEYESRLAPGQPLPNLNPTSGKYQMMVSLWKKLPLPIATMAGPWLAKHLG